MTSVISEHFLRNFYHPKIKCIFKSRGIFTLDKTCNFPYDPIFLFGRRLNEILGHKLFSNGVKLKDSKYESYPEESSRTISILSK